MKISSIFSVIPVFGLSVFFAQDTLNKGFRAIEVSPQKIATNPHKSLESDSTSEESDKNTDDQEEKLIEVEMDEIEIFNKPQLNGELDKRYYSFLDQKLRRVYPLFLEAFHYFIEVTDELKKIDNKRKGKKYIREKQIILAEKYENRLKDLTRSEGQVFCKLMSRATGKTVFEIISQLRGGWSAFWWNVKGNLADIDLKTPYNPIENRDDELVEGLLQSAWNLGTLPVYPNYRDFKPKKDE